MQHTILRLAVRASLILGILSLTVAGTRTMADQNANQPAPAVATVGGGCFWCLEAVYEQLDGVHNVVSGYSGGPEKDPSYREVSSGKTGHAEVVQVTYNPKTISYAKILDWFWKMHDPTTLNRQGADKGPQYRSIILYHDNTQKEIAEQSIANAQNAFDDPIVTQLLPFETFYKAEGYHQDYYQNNKTAGYCMFVIRPKLKKLDLDL